MLPMAYRKKNQDIYCFNLSPQKFFASFIILLIVLENLCICYPNCKSLISGPGKVMYIKIPDEHSLKTSGIMKCPYFTFYFVLIVSINVNNKTMAWTILNIVGDKNVVNRWAVVSICSTIQWGCLCFFVCGRKKKNIKVFRAYQAKCLCLSMCLLSKSQVCWGTQMKLPY